MEETFIKLQLFRLKTFFLLLHWKRRLVALPTWLSSCVALIVLESDNHKCVCVFTSFNVVFLWDKTQYIQYNKITNNSSWAFINLYNEKSCTFCNFFFVFITLYFFVSLEKKLNCYVLEDNSQHIRQEILMSINWKISLI